MKTQNARRLVAITLSLSIAFFQVLPMGLAQLSPAPTPTEASPKPVIDPLAPPPPAQAPLPNPNVPGGPLSKALFTTQTSTVSADVGPVANLSVSVAANMSATVSLDGVTQSGNFKTATKTIVIRLPQSSAGATTWTVSLAGATSSGYRVSNFAVNEQPNSSFSKVTTYTFDPLSGSLSSIVVDQYTDGNRMSGTRAEYTYIKVGTGILLQTFVTQNDLIVDGQINAQRDEVRYQYDAQGRTVWTLNVLKRVVNGGVTSLSANYIENDFANKTKTTYQMSTLPVGSSVTPLFVKTRAAYRTVQSFQDATMTLPGKMTYEVRENGAYVLKAELLNGTVTLRPGGQTFKSNQTIVVNGITYRVNFGIGTGPNGEFLGLGLSFFRPEPGYGLLKRIFVEYSGSLFVSVILDNMPFTAHINAEGAVTLDKPRVMESLLSAFEKINLHPFFFDLAGSQSVIAELNRYPELKALTVLFQSYYAELRALNGLQNDEINDVYQEIPGLGFADEEKRRPREFTIKINHQVRIKDFFKRYRPLFEECFKKAEETAQGWKEVPDEEKLLIQLHIECLIAMQFAGMDLEMLDLAIQFNQAVLFNIYQGLTYDTRLKASVLYAEISLISKLPVPEEVRNILERPLSQRLVALNADLVPFQNEWSDKEDAFRKVIDPQLDAIKDLKDYIRKSFNDRISPYPI